MTAEPPTPTIETERLLLRRHRADDMTARIAMSSDPRVMAHIGGQPQSAEENWARILRYNGHWALLGRGLWAVEEKASGTFVGEAGFADFRRGLGSDFDRYPEGAWVFAHGAQGRGYATEAMHAAAAWMEERFGRERAVCLIAPENVASLRVAEKLGFRPFAERRYHDRPCILLERSCHEG